MPGEFHCCTSQFSGFEMENIGKPEVVLPKQSAKILAQPKDRHNSKTKWIFSTMNMEFEYGPVLDVLM